MPFGLFRFLTYDHCWHAINYRLYLEQLYRTIVICTSSEILYGIIRLLQNYRHRDRWTATMSAALICIHLNNILVLILIFEMIKLFNKLRFYMKVCTESFSRYYTVVSLGLVLVRKSDTIAETPFSYANADVSSGAIWAAAYDFQRCGHDVQPEKPQTSLRIRAVWSEPLLDAWIFYEC